MNCDAGFKKRLAPMNVHQKYEINERIFFIIHRVNGAFLMNIARKGAK